MWQVSAKRTGPTICNQCSSISATRLPASSSACRPRGVGKMSLARLSVPSGRRSRYPSSCSSLTSSEVAARLSYRSFGYRSSSSGKETVMDEPTLSSATSVSTRVGPLRVQTIGSGPPAVLWHSLFVDSTTWIRVQRPLAAGRRLLLIDGPAHGGNPPVPRRPILPTVHWSSFPARATSDRSCKPPPPWSSWSPGSGATRTPRWSARKTPHRDCPPGRPPERSLHRGATSLGHHPAPTGWRRTPMPRRRLAWRAGSPRCPGRRSVVMEVRARFCTLAR